jgi:hypothetical protein
MQRVSIATSHTRELELTLFDPNREPGAPCLTDGACNCKSKTIHNSLLFLIISEGGTNCNVTFSDFGVCGGYGAYMNNMESYDGLDFGRDYCLSGEFLLRRAGKPAMVNVVSIRRKSVPKRYWILAMHGWPGDGINEPTITVHDCIQFIPA